MEFIVGSIEHCAGPEYVVAFLPENVVESSSSNKLIFALETINGVDARTAFEYIIPRGAKDDLTFTTCLPVDSVNCCISSLTIFIKRASAQERDRWVSSARCII